MESSRLHIGPLIEDKAWDQLAKASWSNTTTLHTTDRKNDCRSQLTTNLNSQDFLESLAIFDQIAN